MPTTSSAVSEALVKPETWRQLFDAVYEINAADEHRSFLDATLAGMQHLIPADLYCVHVTDRRKQETSVRMFPETPFTPEEIAYYAEAPSRMPLVAHYERTGETCTRRLSDVIGLEEWLASEYYQTCMARLELVHCISAPVQVDDNIIAGLSMNRKKGDFTLHDCQLLDAFAPHYRLAWRRKVSSWAGGALPREAIVKGQLEKLGLSPREAEVLFWMVEGKQNREIATILGRSLATIQEHVGNIVQKLQQENRHAATVYALRMLQRK